MTTNTRGAQVFMKAVERFHVPIIAVLVLACMFLLFTCRGIPPETFVGQRNLAVRALNRVLSVVPGLPKPSRGLARYVRLTVPRNMDPRSLKLSEVEIRDDRGALISNAAKATQSSTEGDAVPGMALDRSMDTASATTAEAGSWFEVDLGESQVVSKVTVHGAKAADLEGVRLDIMDIDRNSLLPHTVALDVVADADLAKAVHFL